jgi:hypothetical protein
MKPLKKEVKNILNIPLFTEEIIYVDQTNIERNIYNTIRASRHFTEAVKLRRLFLMCTNIFINEGYDFDSKNDIHSSTASEEPLTLEQLNANMIGCFTKQLNNIIGQETRLNQTIDLLTKRAEQWQKIIEYVLESMNKLEKDKTILLILPNWTDFIPIQKLSKSKYCISFSKATF